MNVSKIVLKLSFLLPVLFLIGCSSDDNAPAIKNCRIKEMYFKNPSYTFSFHYNNDGTLKSITSPNYNVKWEYENNRAKTFTYVGGEVITFSYPSENLTTWSSNILLNGVTREHRLYHTGDKVDSLKIIDPENPEVGQVYAEYLSTVTYSTDNPSSIISTSPCCTHNNKNIEYDNGLSPASLLKQCTGTIFSYDVLSYSIISLNPKMLSKNNPIRYSNESNYEYEYTYAKEGSYPVEIKEYVNGSSGSVYYFTYENCD